MRKRLSSKMLAVILALAICATTVLGCLMTASADTSCYTFGTAQFAEDDLTQATIDVTFTANDSLPNGFSAGAFSVIEVDADTEDYLILKDVQPVTDGINIANEGNYYLFDGEANTSVTFTLTFGFSKGKANEGGKEYKIKLTDVELAYGDGAYFVQADANGAVGTISAACKHVIGVVGEPLVQNTANNYSVYAKSVCTLCGEEFGYQLVPTADKNDLAGSDSSVSVGTIDLLEFGDYLTEAGSTSKYWDTNVADNGETGVDWANAIIIDSAEEFVYICKAAGNETAGLYYKVADGIAGFNLTGNKNFDINGTLADNLEIIKGSGKNHSGSESTSFQGHFDGNGVTVYGAWTNHNAGSIGTYTGLFSCTKGTVTIKNLNVNKAHFTSKSATGGIVGYYKGEGIGSLTIENCSVTDSYLEVTVAGYGHGVGALVGYAHNYGNSTNGPIIVNNCYVNLDEDNFISQNEQGTQTDTTLDGAHGGLIGFAVTNYSNNNAGNITNCVVIGITPYATTSCTANNNVQHTALETHFANIYTDQASGKVAVGGSSLGERNFTGRVTQVSSLKGSAAVVAMPNLDWGNTWIMDSANSYPRLVKPGETFDTLYWDGSVASSIAEGSGAKDDPYVINTAAELAWLVQQQADVTDGNYYKIADGIESIVLQPYAYINDIKALDSASAVKSYFESGTFTAWKTTGWEGACFAGYFDGNGATIYGMYATSTNNAALFCTVDGGAAFVNLTIKNSYLTSSADNYQVGALIGTASSTGYGAKRDGIVWVKNITIANNYLYNGCLSTQTNRSGVIGGVQQDSIQVENALVYGNDATYGRDSAIYNMPLLGNCYNTTQVAASHYDGLEVKTAVDGEKTLYYNQVKNSIILGADVMNVRENRGYRKNDPGCYTNVYTDGASGKVALSNGEWTYTEEQIKAIVVSDALGSAAQTAMPNLTWGTDWYCGAEGEYPIQKPFVIFGTSSVATPSLQLVGTNVTYKNDGSLDLNVHFVPEVAGVTPTLYVGTLDGSKFMKLNAVASSKTAQLGDNALMYVIPNLSARDIELVWLPTLVNEGTALVQWGKSEQIALADNARAIIAGDYAAADKNVAAALLNYGNASGVALDSTYDYNAGTVDLLEFGQYLKDNGSTSSFYDTVVADDGETGVDWANAIIIDSAEEFVYICKAAGNETAGLYYKVADGIAGFNLTGNKNFDINGTLADNLEIIKGSGKNHSGSESTSFQGHFDGNGVTVYGAWTNHNAGNIGAYTGLFSCTKGTVTIKNLNVNKAHFTSKNATGGIVGYYKGEGTGSLTIENCSVTDSYLEVTAAGYAHATGALVGYAHNYGNSTNGPIIINNCYVNLDEDNFVSQNEQGTQTDTTLDGAHGGLIGFAVTNYTNNNAGNITNCVVIGITPYATTSCTANNNVQHTALETHFANIYTDQASGKVAVGGSSLGERDFTNRVYQLTLEQMTGDAAKTNMPALDWNNVWTTTSGYPTFINKNYQASTSGITVTWDGTVASGYASGTGTKEDPYIISTAAEFAYMVKDKMVDQAATISPNKYFKVADGISAFVMQKPEYANDIIALGSAADTKAYFEANKANMLKWPNYGWEGSAFCGYFDGNGATVYGLYQVSGNNAGLFSSVDAGAVIQNIAVKNSYLTSTATNYQVAAIAAVSNSGSYGVKQEGVIWVNGCTIANNYMYNAATAFERSGVLAGSFQYDIIMVDNCLVYGNDATYGDGVKMALVGQGNNDVETTCLKPAELPSYVENSGFYCNSVRNSIILDCDVMNTKNSRSYRRNGPNCYVNVYTNGASGTVAFTDSTFTYTDAQIKAISVADVKGDTAQSIIDALNNASIGETVWYVGAAGDYPAFKEASTMPSSAQALYNGMVLNNADDYGDSVDGFGVYATGLNLKVNPYMTFTFVFGYEYTKEDIQVTFKSSDTVIETVTAADMVNNEGAGRYHLYRLKNAPVIALSTGITVSVTYGGVTTDFGTYSAEGFALMADNASKLEPCDYYANLYEASKALLFYADMLAARYGA